MTRNVVDAETAELNRGRSDEYRFGGYTFNAVIPGHYDGDALTVACVRLGDHAHIDVESGCTISSPPTSSYFTRKVTRGFAGHLILRWREWLLLRAALDAVPYVHVVEVESPNAGQLDYHATGHRVLAHLFTDEVLLAELERRAALNSTLAREKIRMTIAELNELAPAGSRWSYDLPGDTDLYVSLGVWPDWRKPDGWSDDVVPYPLLHFNRYRGEQIDWFTQNGAALAVGSRWTRLPDLEPAAADLEPLPRHFVPV